MFLLCENDILAAKRIKMYVPYVLDSRLRYEENRTSSLVAGTISRVDIALGTLLLSAYLVFWQKD